MVAADVRRRRMGPFLPGNPPPHVGGYCVKAISKHALKGYI